MNSKKILITGGSGFIGSHVCRRLLDEGNHVTLVDRYFNDRNELLQSCLSHKNCKSVCADICANDFSSLNFDDFDYIIHAAGVLGVKNVIDNPVETLDVNIIGTANVLKLLERQKNLKRFVHFSSSEIYGSSADSFSESDNVLQMSLKHIRGCYAISKLAGEAYTLAYSRKIGIKTTSVRPFNVYGTFRYGINAITSFIDKALRGENIVVHGDGSQKRAWCYISDFVEALDRLLQSDLGIPFLNIGNSSMVVTTLESACNSTIDAYGESLKIED
ncbi:UDP-glucose 4-epimerase [Alphaproteobacteria bacterium]|nr:UDP-glucose 4-epimerase [Alphaproteobacteria bacterium]